METIIALPAEQAKPVPGTFKFIPTKDIMPDPGQPRQTIKQIPFEELKESIRIDGIIQSLSVRPFEGKYKIMAGSRRLKAAIELGIEEVPCLIREADDDKALHVQIVENLHREDLSPMEQAIAFKEVADREKKNAKEIAADFGVTPYFVRQQLKLTDLIPVWQSIVSRNGITLAIALEISSLPVATQLDLYKTEVSKENEKAEKPVIHINSYTLSKYKGLLTEACFDLNDDQLDTAMGACSICPFNSAFNLLFPGEASNPKCHNISCYKNKTAIHQNNEFEKAKNDPTVLMVYDANGMPDHLKQLKNQGLEFMKLGYADECKEVKEPQKPIMEDFAKWSKNKDLPKREIKKLFDKEVDTYNFKKSVFDKHVATGKYKKAFVAHDSSNRQAGKYIFVEVNPPKATAKTNQKIIAGGNPTQETILEEINRLKEKERRQYELIEERVHEKIVEALTNSKELKQLPKAVSPFDALLINFLLLDQIPYFDRGDHQKVIKKSAFEDAKSKQQYCQTLQSLSKQEISYLARHIAFTKYASNLPNTKGGFMVRKIAETLGTIPIADFEKEQKEVYKPKIEKIKFRIKELEEQLPKAKKNIPQMKLAEKKRSVA